jgi:transcriptional regulator with PAS, ATPase and Fis domain
MSDIAREFQHNKLIYDAIVQRNDINDPTETIINLARLLDALLSNPFEKIIITDQNGNIQFLNEAYARLISADPMSVIGANVRQVLGSETRMHIVGQTLKPELHGLFSTSNVDAVARRIPLISGKHVLGIMGKDLFDNLDDLNEIARQANRLRKLIGSHRMKKEPGNRAKYSLSDIVGEDSSIQKIKEKIQQVARTTSTILIQGETGVGKELFAHAIHQESDRAQGPFICVNCGAIPETLLESELFGYEEGSFTGAKKSGKPGKFEQADGGTILLDEIGDIPSHAQVKLLRVLQEKEVQRIGGSKPIPVDVRVIASTNHDIHTLSREGRFRADLFYRINVVPFHIPPLRERRSDIPLLVTHFISKYNKMFGMKVQGVSRKVLAGLMKYHWPGNIRELESYIESSMNLSGRNASHLTNCPPLASPQQKTFTSGTLKTKLERAEAEMIQETLEQYNGNMEQAAAALDVSLASLYRKVKKYKIK